MCTSIRSNGSASREPGVAQNGHVTVIMPNYATRPVQASEVGVECYDGRSRGSWTVNGEDFASETTAHVDDLMNMDL